MLCCVNHHVKQAVENIPTIKLHSTFTFRDLLGHESYDLLDVSEQEFITFKFHELILRGEIMNIALDSTSLGGNYLYKKLY
ncbi:hypothetical protein BUY43_08150 [Staphylococcus devriesei]|uniref:Uncharacterized protein n=1 Tax=Staphylococcus devriesei TaxID=586733 RepID=A0A2K4DKU4_9STAP|nr:hypothetical protein [Staphylococcus devriesei]MCE5097424.1 hypothetical protein [Staphylococcus devriesei]PNZ87094.1 hypothetical protein CD147_08930 [Staphylococcus devriesei]PTE73949.1 hypothetical protein BUY44_03590 [Staphylococcus devriesei]PTF03360.1 hypothetical protein BUY45_08825 [Staphylococcus devriesei]PTF15505.1 hypothetical protein BUY47_01630 [Staphylococcus devriesei]